MSERRGINQSISFRHSLRGRLTLTFLAVSSVFMLTIAGFAYWEGETALRQSVYKMLDQTTILASHNIESWFADRRVDLKLIAQDDAIVGLDVEQIVPYLSRLLGYYSDFESLFVTDTTGKRLSLDGEEQNFADREYWQQARAGEVAISNILISRLSGNPVFAIAAPIQDEYGVIGVLVGTVTTDALTAGLQDAQLGESGEAYLINQDQFFITPSRFQAEMIRDGFIQERAELEIKVDTPAAEAVLAGESGVNEYIDYRGKQVLGSYVPIHIDGLTWGLIAEVDSSEAFAPISRLRNILAAVFVGSMLALIVATFWVAGQIARPIQKMTAVATELASGGIQQEIEYVGKDEIGVLASAFRSMIAYQQAMAKSASAIALGDLTVEMHVKSADDVLGQAFVRMVENLRRVIGQVTQNVDNIALSSKQLAEAAAQSDLAAQQIAVTIGQVAQGNGQLSQSVDRTISTVHEQNRVITNLAEGAGQQANAVESADTILNEHLTHSIHEVQNAADKSSQSTRQADHVTRDGAKTVVQTINGMRAIAQATDQVTQRVSEMQQRAQEIGKIVLAINEISERTNLLALNAAIEAARAGEHGKGFAVVADEVRKLAEQASRATQEITSLIGAVQGTAQLALDAVSVGSREVAAGLTTASATEHSFQQIQQAVAEVQTQMEHLTKAVESMSQGSQEMNQIMVTVADVARANSSIAEELAASSEQVMVSIQEVSAVSEENSAAAEQVSASTEEVSAQVEQTSASVEGLSRLAQGLREVVGQFRLSKDNAIIAEQIETFKRAHMRWVERVEIMANGGECVARNELVSHMECALGRWYSGIASHELGHLRTFQAIEGPHAQLHQLTHEATDACERSDHATLTRCLREIRAVSKEVVTLLDLLLIEIMSSEDGPSSAPAVKIVSSAPLSAPRSGNGSQPRQSKEKVLVH